MKIRNSATGGFPLYFLMISKVFRPPAVLPLWSLEEIPAFQKFSASGGFSDLAENNRLRWFSFAGAIIVEPTPHTTLELEKLWGGAGLA